MSRASLMKRTVAFFAAMLLPVLGIDHLKLARRHPGRDDRPTDAYGEIAREILA